MKNILRMTALAVIYVFLSVCVCAPAHASSPKREMRATWLTTVANIDWPSSATIGATAQKKELTKMLDSIASMNMNTVLFHIRPACDALYNSKYEPWSSYVSPTRGANPGYDPLQFCIDECHKRGLSCHGWINPYRYNNRSTKGDWTGNNDTTALNYKKTHRDWLLWYTNDIVLDPANPEVIQRIKDVIGDILSKYDIDGILMDDYFYPYGGTTTQDQASVQRWKPEGMAVGDWRRQNVNRMVKACYDTIQAVKPWVTFGVSPFGIWTTSTTVAQQRGVKLPNNISGGNMYAEIYCDPLAWLEEGTIDYISPQLYWKHGGSQDYKTLSNWWGNLSNRFGKHFYSSMAVYRYHDGNEGFTVAEMENQALQNRVAVTDNAPGAVFYNTKAWVYDKSFRKAYKANEFQFPALQPAINWKPAPERVMVSNITLNGTELTWSHPDNDVRFVIYAVPNKYRSRLGIFSVSDVIVGISYSKSFTLPEKYTSGYKIGVSVLDKYNNEYALRIMGEEEETLDPVVLKTPSNNNARKLPFTFEWNAAMGADSYIIQMARDPQFQDIIFAQEVTTTSFSTTLRTNLSYLEYGQYYWRVKARKPNTGDCWSDPVMFYISKTDGVEDIVESKAKINNAEKLFRDGQIIISRGNKQYSLLGSEM